MREKLHRHPQFPRGKVLFAPFKSALREMNRDFIIFFLLAIVSGLAGASIEASENVVAFDTKLFWLCIGLNVLQIISSTIFFKKIRHWERWFAIFSTAIMIGYTFAMFRRLL